MLLLLLSPSSWLLLHFLLLFLQPIFSRRDVQNAKSPSTQLLFGTYKGQSLVEDNQESTCIGLKVRRAGALVSITRKYHHSSKERKLELGHKYAEEDSQAKKTETTNSNTKSKEDNNSTSSSSLDSKTDKSGNNNNNNNNNKDAESESVQVVLSKYFDPLLPPISIKTDATIAGFVGRRSDCLRIKMFVRNIADRHLVDACQPITAPG